MLGFVVPREVGTPERLVESALILDGDLNVEFVGLVEDAGGERDEGPHEWVDIGDGVEQLPDLGRHDFDKGGLSILGKNSLAIFLELGPLPVGGVEERVDGELSSVPGEVESPGVAVGHVSELLPELPEHGSFDEVIVSCHERRMSCVVKSKKLQDGESPGSEKKD